jgi:hypothetical protein
LRGSSDAVERGRQDRESGCVGELELSAARLQWRIFNQSRKDQGISQRCHTSSQAKGRCRDGRTKVSHGEKFGESKRRSSSLNVSFDV